MDRRRWTDLTNRVWLTKFQLRLGEVILAITVIVLLMPQPHFFGSLGPPNFPSPVMILTALAVAGMVFGVAWMHRIASANAERPANDRHWWSRL